METMTETNGNGTAATPTPPKRRGRPPNPNKVVKPSALTTDVKEHVAQAAMMALILGEPLQVQALAEDRRKLRRVTRELLEAGYASEAVQTPAGERISLTDKILSEVGEEEPRGEPQDFAGVIGLALTSLTAAQIRFVQNHREYAVEMPEVEGKPLPVVTSAALRAQFAEDQAQAEVRKSLAQNMHRVLADLGFGTIEELSAVAVDAGMVRNAQGFLTGLKDQLSYHRRQAAFHNGAVDTLADAVEKIKGDEEALFAKIVARGKKIAAEAPPPKAEKDEEQPNA